MPLVLWTLTNFLSIFSTHFWYGICHIQFFFSPKLPSLNHQFDECLGLFCVCLLYVVVVVAFLCASVVCFWVCAYDGNGSMIAMKDIFNKVLPAFFSHWWMDVKKLYGRLFGQFRTLMLTFIWNLFNKTVNKMPVPLQHFFVNTMRTHTSTSTQLKVY